MSVAHDNAFAFVDVLPPDIKIPFMRFPHFDKKDVEVYWFCGGKKKVIVTFLENGLVKYTPCNKDTSKGEFTKFTTPENLIAEMSATGGSFEYLFLW